MIFRPQGPQSSADLKFLRAPATVGRPRMWHTVHQPCCLMCAFNILPIQLIKDRGQLSRKALVEFLRTPNDGTRTYYRSMFETPISNPYGKMMGPWGSHQQQINAVADWDCQGGQPEPRAALSGSICIACLKKNTARLSVILMVQNGL